VAIVSVRTTEASTILQRVVLRPGAVEVELELELDWHEREKILKLVLPVDVRADHVAAETQFGHVLRPTHSNTSWDAARFEVCQHRWMHLGEPGFGVTVTNDASYGYDIERTTREDGGTTTAAGISVLRSPRFPDPETDQGRHVFRYAIAPGTDVADAVRLGYRSSGPARTLRGGGAVAPLVASSSPAVVVETVKLAEDGSGDVVVRLYESLGGRASTRIRLDAAFERAELTDLLERPIEAAPVAEDGVVVLTLRPFQIVTLRFATAVR
jgi:alpha-mannosidase